MNENNSLIKNDFIVWLDALLYEIENSELPYGNDDYHKGWANGCFETQREIARKIRYALKIYNILYGE